MKKTILIITMVVILLSSFVFAVIPTPIHYYKFNGNLNDVGVDTSNLEPTAGSTVYGTGILGQALNASGSQAFRNLSLSNITKIRTVQYWIYLPTIGDDKIITFSDGSVNNFWTHSYNSLDSLDKYQGQWEVTIDPVGEQFVSNWVLVTAVFGIGNHQLYYNNTIKINQSDADTLDWNDLYVFGYWDGSDNPPVGNSIDNLAMWEERLTWEQITESWNSGIGLEYTASGGGEPSGKPDITLLTPVNNSADNSLIYNFTYNQTNEGAVTQNCSLWLNSTGNWALNTTRYSIGNATPNSINDINLTETEWLWNIECTDNASNSSFASENYTLTIDTAPPTLINSFLNQTILFQRNLTGQFNFSDNDLIHSVNISSGSFVLFNQTNISASTFQVNLSRDVGSLAVGTHILTVTYTDGHTAEVLRGDYKWGNGLLNDYMRYDIDGGYIKTESKTKSIFDTWSTEKKWDRYSQTFEPNNPSDTITFIEESDMPIYIYEKPGAYKGSWVVVGNSWKDYVLKGEPDSIVSIKRITDYKVEVTISNIKNNPSKLKFDSIGDLNIVQQNYTFYKTNATITYSGFVSELESQTISLTLNKTDNVNSTTALLRYNGTTKTTTTILLGGLETHSSTFLTPTFAGNQANISFIWFYNITGPVDMESGNITTNQTVNTILIDNCSTHTTHALNITLKEDDTNKSRSGTLNGFFQLWLSDITSTKNISLEWGDSRNHSICISPDNATYNIFGQMEYETNNTEYAKKTYYITNATLTNTTQFLTLYFSPNTTLVTFTVTDQNDNPIPNTFINVLRYDFGTNTHVTTEIIKTDNSGEAIGNIVLDTQWYKFLLLYQNVIIFESEPVKITSTTKSFRVNLLPDFVSFYDGIRNVQTNLIFNNVTNNFVYTFVNPTGTSVTGCLNVINRSALREQLIEKSCQTTSAATILVNIGPDTGSGLFVATGSISGSPAGITNTLSEFRDRTYAQWGKDGMFISIFVKLTMVMIGIWNPIVAVILLILADFSFSILGIYKIGWEAMIAYVIMAGIVMYKLSKN